MRQRTKAIFFGLFSVVALCASPAPTSAPEKYIEMQKVDAVMVRAGKEFTAKIKVRVLPGLHIQANPAAMPNLKPTTFTLLPVDGFEPSSEVKYPEGKPYRMLNTVQDLSVYEGMVEITLPVKTKNPKPGKYELKAELRYQACNDKICFFPRMEKFVVPVQVLK